MQRKKSPYPVFFLMPALILYLIFAIWPTITNLYYAMTDWSMRLPEVHFIGFEQFMRVLHNDKFIRSLYNSGIYGVSITVGKVVIGLLLAVLLNRKLKTRTALRAVYFMPIMISTVAVGLIFRSLMNPSGGFLNQMLIRIGVFSPPQWITDPKMAIWCCVIEETWRGTGLCMAIFLAGLQSVSREYYEAARIDGASSFSQFWRITLPLIRPTLTINILMTLVNGIRGFEPVYYLTGGGPGTASQTTMTLSYKYMAEGLFGYSAAMNFLLIVLILLISIPLLHVMTAREVEM